MKLYERLLAKVKVNENKSWNGMNCLEWQASLNRDGGYGRIAVGSTKDGTRRRMYTHRLAWELFRGPIPDGLHVLHRCDNPVCISPSHLFLGTNSDNAQDKIAKGRAVYRKVLGEANGRAKLCDTDIPVIRKRLAAGESQGSISRDYGVARAQIGRIWHRQQWSHVA